MTKETFLQEIIEHPNRHATLSCAAKALLDDMSLDDLLDCKRQLQACGHARAMHVSYEINNIHNDRVLATRR